MSKALFTNFASTLLDADALSTDTTLSVTATTGSLFPSPGVDEHAVLVIRNVAGDKEVVFMTDRVTDTLTVTRAQEGTTALDWTTGDVVSLTMTKSTMDAFVQRDAPGTIDTPTITDPTITGGSISGLTTDLPVADGGTGASTAAAARTNLGATTVGGQLFTAANAAAALSVLGAGATGATILTAATAAAARGTLLFKVGSDAASGSALSPPSDGLYFDVTGTTSITSIASIAVGTIITVQFDAALTLVHHATDLVLGGSNITTVAGDHATFVEYATGDWRLVNYFRASTPIETPYLMYWDKKTNGTDAGTFTAGSFVARTLTDEVTDTAGIGSLSSNQITLPAGTYRCSISCPAFQVSLHRARLRNATDGTTLILGTSAVAGTTVSIDTRSFVVGQFTLAASKALEVQHRCSVSKSTSGLGFAASQGEEEIYTVAEFWKVG